MLGFVDITPGQITEGGDGVTKRLIFSPSDEIAIQTTRIVCVEPLDSYKDSVNVGDFAIIRYDYRLSGLSPSSYVVNESKAAFMARLKLVHHSWTAYLPPGD